MHHLHDALCVQEDERQNEEENGAREGTADQLLCLLSKSYF